jgi:hypothetical protein
LCAMPWASVSAKRTRIGTENVKPSIFAQYLRAEPGAARQPSSAET